MATINATLNVATLYRCDYLQDFIRTLVNIFDPMWRQTVTGCQIIEILREMYKFNVSYVYEDLERNLTVIGELTNVSYRHNDNVDVYARSMSFTLGLSDHVYPVLSINTWKFGFLLERPEPNFFSSFYSKPFTRPVWNCLYGMALLISILFYLLKRWELSVVGGWECSFSYESLMMIGAYCQHIPPIDAKLASRRIAFFIFFVFAYLVYTFYTSNLLSNLVNETDHGIDLETLAFCDYEFVIVDYMMLAVAGRQFSNNHHNYSVLINKLLGLRSVSVQDGLDAVRNGRVALLSDYTTIYPYIKRTFNNEEICKLIEIDLFSRIKKYFFTSKDFPYKEQFKIGTLRIKEAGILNRIVLSHFEEPRCTPNHLVQTCFVQISAPLTVLMCTYVTSVLILVAERIHFKRNKVWPYVE